ncbi:hypothetical protein AKJ16_DCAP06810 [Drosera capensis]
MENSFRALPAANIPADERRAAFNSGNTRFHQTSHRVVDFRRGSSAVAGRVLDFPVAVGRWTPMSMKSSFDWWCLRETFVPNDVNNFSAHIMGLVDDLERSRASRFLGMTRLDYSVLPKQYQSSESEHERIF